MGRITGIGLQDFGKIITENAFYIDKTGFIKEWWDSKDEVTLITRPRRFGKTLTISMIEHFFSVEYQKCQDLFQNLKIWEYEDYGKLQGTYPVITLSFSPVKETSFSQTRQKICRIIQLLYRKYDFLLDTPLLSAGEKEDFLRISANMEDYEASLSIQQLSYFLYRYYGKKVIILLDEYDTPMQESWINGYWEELSPFIRNLLNSTFKSNPYLERAILTGITRVSKESIFSDLNNLKVITTTSDEYSEYFGFTEKEVAYALNEYDLADHMAEVKDWYDGFTFGHSRDIYNPWSILNYLDTGKVRPYWANTSSNSLVGKLIREGSKNIKQNFETLINGQFLTLMIDEQIVYEQLKQKESAIWSLLLASGYLKVMGTEFDNRNGRMYYQLALTNKEVKIMFEDMIHSWFADYDSGYNDFLIALLDDDLKSMNFYMNRVALTTFSFFDSGSKVSAESEPERFYHGFVLGLIVELKDRYVITSNRESGLGRYDVILEPLNISDDAIIFEFKVQEPSEEKTLEETAAAALKQIREKCYATTLISKGIPQNRIRSYGFAFKGKQVYIAKSLP